MSNKQVQIRGDTRTNLLATTPAAKELAYNSTDVRLHIGNGALAGGMPMPNRSDLLFGAMINGGVAGGTADALTITVDGVTDVAANLRVRLTASANNTGAATLNLGDNDRAIVKLVGGTTVPLEADDIVQDMIYEFLGLSATTWLLLPSGVPDVPVMQTEKVFLAVADANGASVDFTGLITEDFDNYLWDFRNIITSNNQARILGRVRRVGQGSYDSGANEYINYWGLGIGSSAGDNRATSMNLFPPNGAGNNSHIFGDVSLKNASEPRATFWGNLRSSRRSSSVPPESLTQGNANAFCMRQSNDLIDSVQFFPSTGTFTSGKIYMFGMRKDFS